MEFIQLRNTLVDVFRRNPEVKVDALRKLCMAKSLTAVMELIKEHWACLNSRSWEEFQYCLATYYKEYEKDFVAHGIFYNTPCTSGLVCVDDNAETDCIVVRGTAECAAHGKINILLGDSASATVMDHVRCTAHDNAAVVARHFSRVMAYDKSLVKAFDMAKVESDGETSLCLYGTSVANIYKAGTLSVGTRAKVIHENRQ